MEAEEKGNGKGQVDTNLCNDGMLLRYLIPRYEATLLWSFVPHTRQERVSQ